MLARPLRGARIHTDIPFVHPLPLHSDDGMFTSPTAVQFATSVRRERAQSRLEIKVKGLETCPGLNKPREVWRNSRPIGA